MVPSCIIELIGLRENYRKIQYLMGKSMVSCRSSLKSTHWIIETPIYSSGMIESSTSTAVERNPRSVAPPRHLARSDAPAAPLDVSCYRPGDVQHRCSKVTTIVNPWENGKIIGKPWETTGKPWENHGKTIGKWRFTLWIHLVMTNSLLFKMTTDIVNDLSIGFSHQWCKRLPEGISGCTKWLTDYLYMCN